MLEQTEFHFNGEYRILRALAEGGMGSVYLAEQNGVLGFSKTVALKVVKKELLENELFLDLFVGEAKLVADLIHENILQVYQLIQTQGSCGIVMEYIHGCTLDDINDRLDVLNDYMVPDLATFAISRVARALSYAHNKLDREGAPLGIVHRDVSPPNILVSWDGVVKLSDFGIAKARDMRSPDEQKHVIGKIPFLSPEQVALQGADARSDIFSLGLVWYELLSGRSAYGANDLEELRDLHEAGLPPSVREFNPGIPETMENILLKMIAQDPNARFQTAHEVAIAMETYLYSGGYGPTNEKLRDYLHKLFPEVEKKRIVADTSNPKPTYFKPTQVLPTT